MRSDYTVEEIRRSREIASGERRLQLVGRVTPQGRVVRSSVKWIVEQRSQSPGSTVYTPLAWLPAASTSLHDAGAAADDDRNNPDALQDVHHGGARPRRRQAPAPRSEDESHSYIYIGVFSLGFLACLMALLLAWAVAFRL